MHRYLLSKLIKQAVLYKRKSNSILHFSESSNYDAALDLGLWKPNLGQFVWNMFQSVIMIISYIYGYHAINAMIIFSKSAYSVNNTYMASACYGVVTHIIARKNQPSRIKAKSDSGNKLVERV